MYQLPRSFRAGVQVKLMHRGPSVYSLLPLFFMLPTLLFSWLISVVLLPLARTKFSTSGFASFSVHERLAIQVL